MVAEISYDNSNKEDSNERGAEKDSNFEEAIRISPAIFFKGKLEIKDIYLFSQSNYSNEKRDMLYFWKVPSKIRVKH